MFNRLLPFICTFLAFAVLVAAAPDSREPLEFIPAKRAEMRVVVIHSYNLQDFEDHHYDNFFVAATRLIDVDIKMKRFYMGVNETTTATEGKALAERMMDRIKVFNPDKIIIIGQCAYKCFKPLLRSLKIPIGLFDAHFVENVNLESLSDDGLNTFTTYEVQDINPFVEYLNSNGIDLNVFYFIRDTSKEMLEQESVYRDQIYSLYPRAEIKTYIVHSIQDLRAAVADLQVRKLGVMIYLLRSLPNYDKGRRAGILEISEQIRKTNVRQIELSLAYNAADAGIAFTYYHLHRECRQAKRFHISHLLTFLTAYKYDDGDVFIQLPRRLVLNGQRISELGLGKALKDLSLVHCFRDSYL